MFVDYLLDAKFFFWQPNNGVSDPEGPYRVPKEETLTLFSNGLLSGQKRSTSIHRAPYIC